MDLIANGIERQLAFDLRATWQARTLEAAKGKTAAVLISVLAHNFDDQMLTLLQVVFPGFSSITAPFLCSAGKVEKNGSVVADMVERNGTITRKAVLYRNEIDLRDDFRRLADELKLNDADRNTLFACVQKWVVCDFRLDPTFDPKDPDAKRLMN